MSSGGERALSPIRDGEYHLKNVVVSDWMEFDRLVEILVEHTTTPSLIAAMNLVTGPPLGGIAAHEWIWAKDLRDEIRSRVADAAVVLARRLREGHNYPAALEVARKGLGYDTARQDLWKAALTAAQEGRDKEAFRELRGRYLAEIPSADRDSAVVDLTGRAG